MQNTKVCERYCEWLRGKVQTNAKYHVMHRLEQVSKGVVQKQANGK